MRRLAAVAVTAVLTLSACTGAGGDDKTTDAPSLPLPDKVPSARGPAIGPALEPKVLLASADELEELTGSIDAALVQRRSDAFISGRTVVGYSVDDVSGYDLDSGDQLWTAKLDLEGGTICFVSQPDRAVKTFTVAYGESSFCSGVATIRVSDGKVLKKTDMLDGLREFEGESAGGSVSHLFTVKGQDYLVDMRGVIWEMVKGEPVAVARLEDNSYYNLHPTPKGDMLIGTRSSDDRCRVDAFALPSFEHAWTQESKTLFPEVREDCIITAAPGNSAWLAQTTLKKHYLVQVDPATGKVLGKIDAPKRTGGGAPKGEFDLDSASLHLDQALGLPGGDTVFAQMRGLTRYSLETGKIVWDLDLTQVQLESEEDYPMTTVLPQGVTADGYLVASVSNDTAAEIMAVDVKTGKLVARWAVPEEYRNGFQVDPGMTLFGGGIVLTRNFEEWERTFADYLGVKEPKGDRYDIGVFTFPKPDNSASGAVPTVGPVDTEAKALGGIKTPEGSKGGRHAGAFSTGGRLVAYAGNTVTGLDPKSGDEKWTLKVDDDPAAYICVAPDPDQKVKTFTIAYRGGAKGATCDTLLRVRASDGKVLDRVKVPASARTVARIEVHEGVVHVITGDKVVSRIADGALVKHARLAHSPYSLQRTPQDPSLVIGTSSLKGGRDWAIDAYRLPTFEHVWSTTGKKVFSRIDRSNWVVAWRGNGLWLSTTFGDVSKLEGKVKDSLAQLDPESGRVVARTGAVKRDYLADDLRRFSLTEANSAAYDTVGFDDGDVLVPQESGVMRYSLAEKEVRWSVDTASIMGSMERDRAFSPVTQHFDLVDAGKTVLVTLSNNTSVEMMRLKASSGKITGRWNVPVKFRNGLQTSPTVTPYTGGFALSHNDYSWDYALTQPGREVQRQQRYDVGLFKLNKPKG